MRPEIGLLACAALATLAPACTRQADTAAEEKVIRALDKKWVEAVAAKDTMAIGAVYAEDGEFLAPGAPRATGRTAIRAAWAQFLKAPNLSLTFEPTTVTVSSAGDIAYETGSYHLSMGGPNGQKIDDVGKYVVAWKLAKGEWQAQYDIFNSDTGRM